MQDAWTDQEARLEAEGGSADGGAAPEEKAPAQPTFDQKLDALGSAVMRHPLNREVLYKALAYCSKERTLAEAEDYIASLPQFKTATQNQYYLLASLAKAHGLELVERDEAGGRVLPEQKEGLSEDEIDDLVATVSFKTTDVGAHFVEYNRPQARLVDELELAPERAGTYREVLEFVDGASRSYVQIAELLRGRPALQTVIDGRRETMQPSVFVDKLERAGALVWKDGWTLTEEGRDFLEDLRENGREDQ